VVHMRHGKPLGAGILLQRRVYGAQGRGNGSIQWRLRYSRYVDLFLAIDFLDVLWSCSSSRANELYYVKESALG